MKSVFLFFLPSVTRPVLRVFFSFAKAFTRYIGKEITYSLLSYCLVLAFSSKAFIFLSRHLDNQCLHVGAGIRETGVVVVYVHL